MRKTLKPIQLNRVHVERAIRDNGHLYFGATFKKVNGDIRVMSAKTGVRKGLKGGINKVVKENNSYMTVYDNNAKGFRTLNLATVQTLTMQGRHYEVV